MNYVDNLRRALIAGICVLAGLSSAAQGQEKANITGLADVAFGLVASPGDKTVSQSLCVFTSSRTERYTVLAVGSGSGGQFVLNSGAFDMPYDLLWADYAGASGGTMLAANALTAGFSSPVKQHSCKSGPPTSATLTVVLRDQTLQQARAGSYFGLLQITIAPE